VAGPLQWPAIGAEDGMTDWDATCAEARGLFRDLLRIDTTNPPGNERAAAEHVKAVLEREGIAATLLESAPGRANVAARLAGDGSAGPLLLHGHLDVVPAEAGKWTVPPFAAEVKDGFIHGRGAVDMKNFVAAALTAVLMLKRSGTRLRRDVIFAAVADEETGMRFGSGWLAEKHSDLVRAEYAIGEGGGFQMHAAGKSVFPVMIAEKGVCWLRLKATGTPGHGSIPHRDMALPRLARAAHVLGSRRLPHHVTPPVRRMVEALAAVQGRIKGGVLKQILNPRLAGVVLDRVLPDKGQGVGLAALLHDTATPTVLRAGEKTNVIPSEATLEVDGRVLPGRSVSDFLAEIRAAIGETFEIEVIQSAEPVEVPWDDPFVDAVRATIGEAMPGAAVVPLVLPGYTDAKSYNKLGAKTYGFSPMLMPKDLAYGTLAHGHDERISVAGFDFGVKTLHALVTRLAG
jgi:acetylornithine deacetylase/succinyl-diaminopimelate desuccinylase-like protein